MADNFNISDTPPAAGTIALASVQARRTALQTITTSFVDITLDATDTENDPAFIEHDSTNTDRITLKRAGLYEIFWRIDIEVVQPQSNSNGLVIGRVRANDTVILNGSDTQACAFDDSSIVGDSFDNAVYNSFEYTAAANDFITLQVSKIDVGGTPLLDTRAGGVIFGARARFTV